MPHVAVIRGASLNLWEMQNFEPLARDWDVVAYGANQGGYPLEGLTLPVRALPLDDSRFVQSGWLGRAGARLGVWRRPDGFLVGLEEALADAAIVHAAETAIPFSEQAVRAKERHGMPIVLTCWETIPFAYEENPVIHARCVRVRAQADLFLATTRRAARALEREGVESDRVRVVMPGVDVERFQPGPRDPELMARYGLPSDALVTLFVGRLIGEKGIRELLLAFACLRRRLPPARAMRCRLLIAGTGPQRRFLETLIADLGLGGSAQIIGGMGYKQIHRLHQLADVFVLPSIPAPYWEEQYGMVLAEAMACGTPVVSTETGGIPEVVGDAGVLVPPLESDALADALVNLLADDAARECLGERARRRAVACLNAEQTAAQIDAAYRSLLKLPFPADNQAVYA